VSRHQFRPLEGSQHDASLECDVRAESVEILVQRWRAGRGDSPPIIRPAEHGSRGPSV
jgi:hypothetical protein